MNMEPAVAQIRGLKMGMLVRLIASRSQVARTEGALRPLSLSFARMAQARNSPGAPATTNAQRHPQRSAIAPPRRKARKVPTGLPAMMVAIADVARRGK